MTLVLAGIDMSLAQVPPDHQPSPTTQPTGGLYWLRVTADELNVRSRPDANSIVMSRVPQGTLLRGDGSQFGWHRVMPPADAFSYASAEYVYRRSETEGQVNVRDGRLRIRVGSTLADRPPLQSEVQTLVERGARVTIVGEQDGWYKIVPPPEVRGYVSGEHVVRVSDEEAGRLLAAQAATQPAALLEPVPEAPPTIEDRLTGPWGQRLLLVETVIEVEDGKPLLEQSWEPMIARLEPIAEQREDPLAGRLATGWIGQLRQRMAEQEAFAAAKDLLRRSEREEALHQRELERIERLRRPPAESSVFDARGVLLRSIAVGDAGGKRWYKLQNPMTAQVTAFLEIGADSHIDAESYMGKFVGVEGDKAYEPALGIEVLRVRAIVVLGPGESTSRPAVRSPE